MFRISLRLALIAGLMLTFLLAGCERSGATNPAEQAPRASAAQVDGPELTVYKSPTCGCCIDWAEYMEEEGFNVTMVDVPVITQTQAELGVPRELGSCHTGVVEGYLVEGHVPADDVRRLLAERPDAAGISVPGMPIGSPGMEVPGRPPQPYNVYLFSSEGDVSVYARH